MDIHRRRDSGFREVMSHRPRRGEGSQSTAISSLMEEGVWSVTAKLLVATRGDSTIVRLGLLEALPVDCL